MRAKATKSWSESQTHPPAMHRVLSDKRVAAYEDDVGRERIKRAAEQLLGRVRLSGNGAEFDAIVLSLTRELDRVRLTSPRPVINGTGIILHTNLGRAPLPRNAIDAVAETAGRYSNLEFDLETGGRGSRYGAVADLICEVTGAQDAVVVNNCAAAVLLVLDTLAKGREVIVGRNELVEIGGGFRVPEVLERSGARLVEVGATNRVYVEDYERALSTSTSLVLRTHASNFRIDGFVNEPSPQDLVALGRRSGVPVVEDLGSGALVDLAQFGAAHERTVQEALDDGISIVVFSGDKLLGGPQSGIVAGKASLIARSRNNPLLRALRIDKMTLAALHATLRCYRDGTWRDTIPIYRILGATLDALRDRARSYVSAIPSGEILEAVAYAGGGSLPESRIPSIAVAIAAQDPKNLAASLRRGSPPLVARIEDDRLLIDLRTVAPEEDAAAIAALKASVG